jgi:predicted metalloprotease with PDZ domain
MRRLRTRHSCEIVTAVSLTSRGIVLGPVNLIASSGKVCSLGEASRTGALWASAWNQCKKIARGGGWRYIVARHEGKLGLFAGEGAYLMRSSRKLLRIAAIFILGLGAFVAASAQSAKPPIQITADLSDAPRKLFHAEVDLPATAGPLTLTTPKWIPGQHMPSGPVGNIVGVVFTANGHALAWRRDDVDLYQFHLTIPAGVTTLHAHLDCIVTANVSQKTAVLDWENLLLYPAGMPVRDIPIQPAVIVPAGWGVGTALTPIDAGAYPVPVSGSTTRFAVTNVEQLQDSPIMTGLYFREFVLAPEISPQHYLDVASDLAEDSNLRASVLAEFSNLVREADALYRSHHYNQYHFLLTLSDAASGERTLEHGQSSENGVGEKSFSDDSQQLPDDSMLPHEYSHSWCGKYRRPAGLYQPDFATPQQGALLWVYEGLTQYYGEVLATRAGFMSPALHRDVLALTAAYLDHTPGREWRTTEDTGIAASLLRNGSGPWANWRRGQDYYDDGQFIWLDADTLIRKTTNDQKSLDDLARIFLGQGGNTGPLIVPYTFDEVVRDLNQVMPYDWVTFLHERLDKIQQHGDLAGVERGGYKLIYADAPNALEASVAGKEAAYFTGTDEHGVNAWHSVGLIVGGDGSIVDVRWHGPADKAKIVPGAKIMAVNGQAYSGDLLRAAIRDAKGGAEAIHLIVQLDNFISVADIDYHDGEQFPVLERVEGTSDYLDDIVKPLASSQQPAQPKTTAANR